jgi:hypothetical protein
MLTDRLTLGFLTLAATVLTTACTPSPTVSTDSEPPSTASTQAEVAPTPAPATIETDTADGVAQTAPETRSGSFESAEHETVGEVELVRGNGQSTLVFDGTFSTSDGPDLVVVLHRSANVIAESTPPAYPLAEADYIVIAPLTSITGTQEYVIPAEIDLSAFASVAIWCQAFNATFGVAPLQ